jgi:hypothetical protein
MIAFAGLVRIDLAVSAPDDTLVAADITETSTGKGWLDLADLDAGDARLRWLRKEDR